MAKKNNIHQNETVRTNFQCIQFPAQNPINETGNKLIIINIHAKKEKTGSLQKNNKIKSPTANIKADQVSATRPKHLLARTSKKLGLL